jgi:hypothetical protein
MLSAGTIFLLPEGHPPFATTKIFTNLGPIKQQRDTSMIATGHGVKWLTELRSFFTLRQKSKEDGYLLMKVIMFISSRGKNYIKYQSEEGDRP